jgi:hypothetical protein
MKSLDGERGSEWRVARYISTLAAALVAFSCAAPLKIESPVDPLSILEPGLSAYARLEGATARKLLPSILPAEEAKSLEPLLKRTGIAAIGASAPGPGASAGRLEAVLAGDFPFRGSLFALASNSEWKREGRAYRHEASGIRATVPAPGLVLASSGPVDALLSRLKERPPSPLPARLSGFAQRELVIWLPDPFARLGLGEDEDASMGIPSRGLLLSADSDADGSYLTTICFLMGDADAARIYRPALRVAWYLVSRALLGEGAEAALGARFALDGDLVYASGITLSGEAIARALSMTVPGAYPSLNAQKAP